MEESLDAKTKIQPILIKKSNFTMNSKSMITNKIIDLYAFGFPVDHLTKSTLISAGRYTKTKLLRLIKGHSHNFGDYLSYLIVKSISAYRVRLVPPSSSNKLLAIGTVLEALENYDTIWGSGARSLDSIPRRSDVKVSAIRGPLTKKALAQAGTILPDDFNNFFDPAILFRLLQNSPKRKSNSQKIDKNRILFIPHYKEYSKLFIDWKQRKLPSNSKVIHPFLHPQVIAAEIASSCRVVSSSLHGIILSDVFNIPVHPFISTENPFKYQDYYEGTGRTLSILKTSWSEALDTSFPQQPSFNQEFLESCLKTFPYPLLLDQKPPLLKHNKINSR
jgi:pyruvyltransferase